MATAATAARRRAAHPMTQVVVTDRYETHIGGPGSGRSRVEVWGARSDDGVWRYIRAETRGTPWDIVHVPTEHLELPELAVISGSLPEARRWTANGGLNHLTEIATRIIADQGHTGGVSWTPPGLTDDERARIHRHRVQAAQKRAVNARRALAILAGQVLPPTAGEPETLCGCGGLLVPVGNGWRHIDGCRECWLPGGTGWNQPCHDPFAHTWCVTPEPVACGHGGCARPHALAACPRGLTYCCGCCEGDR